MSGDTIIVIAALASTAGAIGVCFIWAGRVGRGIDDLEASVGRRFDAAKEQFSKDIGSVQREASRIADQMTIQNGRLRKVEEQTARIDQRCLDNVCKYTQ